MEGIITTHDGDMKSWFVDFGPKHLGVKLKCSIYQRRLWRVSVILPGGQELSRFGLAKDWEEAMFECRVSSRELAIQHYGIVV
jgi:hypothetical protein